MRDSFNAAFAGLSKEDSRALFESFSKPVKGAGMLYPVSISHPAVESESSS